MVAGGFMVLMLRARQSREQTAAAFGNKHAHALAIMVDSAKNYFILIQ